MRHLRKPILIFVALLGAIIVAISLLLWMSRKIPTLTDFQILLLVLIGLFFLLLGLSMLRSESGRSNGVKKALMNIERIIAPLSNQISRWRFFRNPRAIDGLCYGLLIVFAVLFTLGRWNGNTPFIFVYDDGGTIASMAAAMDHPQNFISDPSFRDPSFYNSYVTIFMPIIRSLGNLVGDYGMAFIIILPIMILTQAVGVYLLGKIILHNRFLAFLLSIFSFTPIYATNWDYFGLTTDVLPRQLYQCLVVYVFLLAINWREQPKKWLWIMLFLGLLTYMYTVSGLPVAFAIWLGLVIFFPKHFSGSYKRMVCLGIGFLYVITIIPLVIFFRNNMFSTEFSTNPEALTFFISNFQTCFTLRISSQI